MIKQVVIWKVKDPSRRDEQRAGVKDTLESLRGKIPGLLAIEVGRDIGYDGGAADVALYCEFADRNALDAYQTHPLHLDAKKIVAQLVTDRRVVDWEI